MTRCSTSAAADSGRVDDVPAVRRWWSDGAQPPLVLLVHWGETVPFELQLAARLLSESGRRGGDRFAWRWHRADVHGAPPDGAFWLIAQEPPCAPHEGPRWPPLRGTKGAAFVGPAALWFAQSPLSRDLRASVHWEDAAAREQLQDHVVLSPSIIEVAGRWTTCSGGFAVVDLVLSMLREFTGSAVTLRVMDVLCIERLREPGALQRRATAEVLGAMAPKLAEAVALMEANIEEPLQTDEIARLTGISRRQLERLFKQHFSTVPSRYYLDVRLQRARKLIRETRHSVLQVALMCGFSSGSHFSTTYGSVFGVTPREERQRALA